MYVKAAHCKLICLYLHTCTWRQCNRCKVKITELTISHLNEFTQWVSLTPGFFVPESPSQSCLCPWWPFASWGRGDGGWHTCVCMCMRVYACMFVCMYVCSHAHAYVCKCVCKYVCIYARVRACYPRVKHSNIFLLAAYWCKGTTVNRYVYLYEYLGPS